MSYKRVVEKSGKTYGPYRYESYRDENGKVKKKYLGKVDEKRENSFVKKSKDVFSSLKSKKINSKVFVYFGVLLFLVAIIFLVPKMVSVTGLVVSNESINSTLESPSISEIESMMIEKDGVPTLQYKAVIGRPVKWIKKIKAENENVSVKLPKGASDISVLTDEEIDKALTDAGKYVRAVEEYDREEIVKGSLISGNVIFDIDESDGILTRFWRWLSGRGITGNVILEEELSEEIVETADSTIIDLKAVASDKGDLAVEYYTEAPKANETILKNGKRIVISAPSELNYTDVLAYSVVEGMGIRMDNPNLKMYWYEDTEDNIVYEDTEEEFVEEEPEEQNVTEEEVVSEEESQNIEDSNVSLEENVSEILNESESNESILENSTEEPEEQNSTEEEINITEVEENPEEQNSTEKTTEEITEEIVEEEVTEEIVEEGIEEKGNETTSLITGQVISVGTGEEVKDNSEKNRAKLDNEVEKYLNPDLKMDRVKQEIEFIPYDFDSDGYVDYIEWVVPHLSVQVYEIIYVTRAEHLDENRSFIDDVYKEVSQKDGVFTSPIYDGEYLRVIFERSLNSNNDITIHARSNGSSSLEVYTKDGNEVVTVFEEIGEEDTQKIYLTGLVGSTDTFDLKVVGDEIEFDYVVDPSPLTLSIPQTFSVHGRLSNSSGTLNGTYEINFTFYDAYTSGNIIWTDTINVTTDGVGVYTANLNVTDVNFTEQYYLGINVEGDGEMSPRLNLTSTPYAFMAQRVYVGGIVFDENMDASGHNITADYFIGDGSGLTNLPSGGGSSGAGWENDSINTNTSLNVNIDGDVVIKI